VRQLLGRPGGRTRARRQLLGRLGQGELGIAPIFWKDEEKDECPDVLSLVRRG
jgi:hypothetical protein